MKTSSILKAGAAGVFYPNDGAKLHEWVRRFLREGHAAETLPKAVIAPHAGFLYSGPIAGSAFAAWAAAHDSIKRVVVAGPSHRHRFNGIAIPSSDYFATPLGLVPVDTDAMQQLRAFPQIVEMDSAFRHEHCIETHLPFLQEALGEFSLVPLVVGNASPRDMVQALNLFWDDPATVFSISSDLSHYLPYDEAVKLDALTTRAIENDLPHDIAPDQACGRIPILGLLHLAGRHKLTAHTLDVRNSGDTSGDRSRVVGYGAYAFS